MKTLKLITVLLFIGGSNFAQQVLTLEECYSKGRENFPLIKQKQYVEMSKQYNVSNIWKGYLPQITLNSQATYQSDVTSIPFSLPGMKIEPPSKDQYKTVADVSQVIYDGGIMSSQASIQKAGAEVDDYKIEIEFIKVKERINQIYFGILLFDQQLLQTDLIKKDLHASLDKMTAALANGTVSGSNVDVLKAEVLKISQREIELKSSRNSFIDMLGLLINQNLHEPLTLILPEIQKLMKNEVVSRPELELFSSQKKLMDQQGDLSLAKILPKASLFLQGGYGKPTLNMFKNNFDWYYVTGARLTWQLSNLYTHGNESEVIELNKKSIEAQKETFLLNTKITTQQFISEIEKLTELVKVDEEIILMRTSIKSSAQAQFENGVITSNDYLRELNAEDQAKQNLAIHTIQLLLAQQNYKLAIGN